jgi:hypothetical protein
MNRMHRMFSLICLAIVYLTFTVTTFAQDAPPVPTAPGEAAPRATITLIQPAMFGGIDPSTVFQWSDIGATSYTLIFRMVYSGEVFKWKPAFTCNGSVCQTQQLLDTFFDLTTDSSIVDWSVKTTLNGVRVRSEARRLTVEEVTAPTPLTPYNEQNVDINSFVGFTWQHPATAAMYTLFVKDYDSGTLITKQKVNPAVACWQSIPYNRCKWDVTPGLLQGGRHYFWYLKVIGVTGEKATSAKYHLFTK